MSDEAQHHRLLQWHKGLHGAFDLGCRAQGRGPIRAATIRRLLCRHVENRPCSLWDEDLRWAIKRGHERRKPRPSMMIYQRLRAAGDDPSVFL